MENLARDLRFAVRGLRQHPSFTLLSLLALALGIGANTAIFSVVNAVLLRPIAVEHPDRVVVIYDHKLGSAEDRTMVSPGDFLDWKQQASIFDAMSPVGYQYYNVLGLGAPMQALGVRVDSDFFRVMTMKPLLGRTLGTDEDRPGHEKAVVLRHSFWQSRFGGDRGVVGRTVSLNGEPYTVLGVMPPGYIYPAAAQFWLPAAFSPQERSIRWRYLFTIGRLKAGVSLARAGNDMSTIAKRLERQYPDTNTGWGVNVVPLREVVVGKSRAGLLVLLGAVALVLVIACADVAILLLARANVREREMGVRAALGASRPRVLRQLLTESVLLSLTGGALGLLLAWASLRLLVSFVLTSSIPRQDEIGIDAPVLLVTFLISVVTGLAFGLAPGLQSTRVNMVASLREAKGQSAGGSRGRRSLKALLVGEVALAMMVLIAAGLVLRSFANLRAIDVGFVPEHQVLAPITLPSNLPKYKEPAAQNAFYRQLMERIAALPGVLSVGAINQPPLQWPATVSTLGLKDRPAPAAGQEPTANIRIIRGDYFGTMRIPLLRGEKFTTADTGSSRPVALVNRELADTLWPRHDAVGKRFTYNAKEWTIVGEVGNSRERSLTEPATPSVYIPHDQQGIDSMAIVVRTATDPERLLEAVRRQVWSLDPDLPLDDLDTWNHRLVTEVADPRSKTVLLGAFAALALVLAVLGIYGIVSYSVTQRTNEIGIRLALGAEHGQVLRLVLGQGVTLALAGVALGLAGALVVTRLLASLLFGVSPVDPLTFAAVALFLVLVAILASYLPARRAMSIEPQVALRYD